VLLKSFGGFSQKGRQRSTKAAINPRNSRRVVTIAPLDSDNILTCVLEGTDGKAFELPSAVDREENTPNGTIVTHRSRPDENAGRRAKRDSLQECEPPIHDIRPKCRHGRGQRGREGCGQSVDGQAVKPNARRENAKSRFISRRIIMPPANPCSSRRAYIASMFGLNGSARSMCSTAQWQKASSAST
jgi:hypothetical protein